MKEYAAPNETIRLVHEITPGFSAHHPDEIFDRELDSFFERGTLNGREAADPEVSEKTSRRLEKLHLLENNHEGKRFCSELRDAIQTHFAVGRGQRILLEAMKFMLRVHIDDKDRIDSGLPGVSHQLKVAKNVLDVLARQGQLNRYDATILAAAMFHDIVEDHEQLLLLEHDKLAALYKQKDDQGKPILSENDSPKTKVITLLEDESGVAREIDGHMVVVPNVFMGEIMRLVTLDRAEILQSQFGLSHEEATAEATRLQAKRNDVSPEVYAAHESRKREIYKQYTLDTFTDPRRAGEAASLIKILDLTDNALTIGSIRKKADDLARGDEASKQKASELRKKYDDLKNKYEEVLIDLYTALPAWPRDTLVGSIALEKREEIGRVLREEYKIQLEQ